MDRSQTLRLAIYQVQKEIGWLKTQLLEYMYPSRCVGCERLGVLLCDECAIKLTFIEQSTACPRCGAPLGSLVCTECTPVYDSLSAPKRSSSVEQASAMTMFGNAHHPQSNLYAFSRACCALEFDDLSRRIVLEYKDRGEQRLADLIADLIARAMPKSWCVWADLITWIPADKQAHKRRGFDHMELVAMRVAQLMGVKAQALLVKLSLQDQRALDRKQRQENMLKVFELLDTATALGDNILLIDDVFTTGATLSAAAKVLSAAHAKEIRVATLCRVW